MDIENFVQNLKSILDARGISYARAGRESGAGEEFIRNMERKKSIPSVEKVQMLADYLGVTTSELLGEEASPLYSVVHDIPPQGSIDELVDIADDVAPRLIKMLKMQIGDNTSVDDTPVTMTLTAEIFQAASGKKIKQPGPLSGTGLTPNEQALIALFRLLPVDDQEAVVRVVRAAADAQKSH